MMTSDRIKKMIETKLPGSEAHVQGNDGTHFEAQVICADFAGHSVIKQHRMVYDALGTDMGTEIHALGLKTYTPEQWQNHSKQ
jgi:acid stress-induced BolA-like protein IbaG/YrbA